MRVRSGNKLRGLIFHPCQSIIHVLREFLLPSEEEEAKRTRQWPKEGRLCILCKRAEIARAFINIRADGMGVKNNMILQDYRNIVNITTTKPPVLFARGARQTQRVC